MSLQLISHYRHCLHPCSQGSSPQNCFDAFLQALHVSPTDCYNIHWPIVRGQFNLHSGPGGSLTAVLTDLETLWGHVIQKQLDIPLKDLKVGDTSG